MTCWYAPAEVWTYVDQPGRRPCGVRNHTRWAWSRFDQTVAAEVPVRLTATLAGASAPPTLRAAVVRADSALTLAEVGAAAARLASPETGLPWTDNTRPSRVTRTSRPLPNTVVPSTDWVQDRLWTPIAST